MYLILKNNSKVVYSFTYLSELNYATDFFLYLNLVYFVRNGHVDFFFACACESYLKTLSEFLLFLVV